MKVFRLFALIPLLCASAGKASPFPELFEQTGSFFGVDADRDNPVLLEQSVFGGLSIDDGNLSFDLGNHKVNGAVGPRGDIRRLLIFTGIKQRNVSPAGVWCDYQFLNICRSDRFAFEVKGEPVYIDQKGLQQQTRLVSGAFPLTSVQMGELKVRQLVMAPYADGAAVRGLLVGFYVETESVEPVNGKLHIPRARRGWGPTGKLARWVGPMPEELTAESKKGKKKAIKREGRAEFVLLDGLESTRAGDTLPFTVSKEKPLWIPVLLVADEKAAALPALRAKAEQMDSLSLVEDTVDYLRRRMGHWEIGGQANAFASMTRRIAYLQIASLLETGDGTPVGSSWGSDASEPVGKGKGQRSSIWMHDTFYNYLSAGLLEPKLMLDGAKFYMTRSVPKYPDLYLHGYMNRIQKDEKRIPHSIGNAVSPIILAGHYYALNGDGDALRKLRETTPNGDKQVTLEEVMVVLLDALLASRDEPDGPMLFETFFLSDPRTHGKYHTGSNILVWHAFKSAARLLDEVFGQPDKAKAYRAVAQQMEQDIPKYCIIEHKGTKMYAEGYQAGKLDIAGEESGTVIASALGFCEVDDPFMMNRFNFFDSPDNPSYDAATGGAAWMNRCITFPGYVTDFASASTEEEIIEKGEKLLSMTDIDGAWWWWPIKLGKTQVQRNWVGKCGWGKGMFLVNFFDKIIGLKWDAPTQQLTLRPFVAWEQFTYDQLKFGSLEMDLDYQNTALGATVDLKHNQPFLKSFTLTLRAPHGTKACQLVKAPEGVKLIKGAEYFGKPTWELHLEDVWQSELSFQVKWVPEV